MAEAETFDVAVRGLKPAARDEHFEEMMMLGKRTIVAALMVAMICSVSVALADGGTIKGVAKW